MISTSDPTGPAGDWSAAQIDLASQLTGVSCILTSPCVAVDSSGSAFVSSTPYNGASWTSQVIDPSTRLAGVSCTTDGMCMAIDTSNAIVGVIPSSTPPPTTSPISSASVQQVVFVHGINASCANAGNQHPGAGANHDYSNLYQQLTAANMQVYTFCYDHDIAFGDHRSWNPNRCFSDTSVGTSSVISGATAARENQTAPHHIGPLYVSANKPGASDTDDGDDALAYEAAKLDDCLKYIVNYDVATYGHPLPIAVIGNSMGGAVTRGWLELAKSRSSLALQAVTTTLFLEPATEGSWIAHLGEDTDAALSTGSLTDEAVRILADYGAAKGHLDPRRAGVQDLDPASPWYRSVVAAGPPPRLHYYTFSVDITVRIGTHVLFYTTSYDTDFIGDGVLQAGSTAWNALPAWGGSQFLPFGSGSDQHEYLIRRTVDESLSLHVGFPPSGSLSGANPYADPYNHFNFGTNMGKANGGGLVVPSCQAGRGTLSIPAEVSRDLLDPAGACANPIPLATDSAAPASSAAPFQPTAAAASIRAAAQPVIFRSGRGGAALALYTARGPHQGQFALRSGSRVFEGTLPRRALGHKVIRLNVTLTAVRGNGHTLRLLLKGSLVPATHWARLTVRGRHPSVAIRLTPLVADVAAAASTTNRVRGLLDGGNVVGLARTLSPGARGGESASMVAAQLRASRVRHQRLELRGAGRLLWLPDGDPAWAQPVTATATGHRPLRTDLLFEQSGGRWWLLGSTS